LAQAACATKIKAVRAKIERAAISQRIREILALCRAEKPARGGTESPRDEIARQRFGSVNGEDRHGAPYRRGHGRKFGSRSFRHAERQF
jgi:hypothetical protein